MDIYTIQIEAPDEVITELKTQYANAKLAELKAWRIWRVADATGDYGTIVRVFENGREYSKLEVR